LFSLGKASGSQLLYDRALTGAIEWTLISPAFTIGGELIEGIPEKA